MKRVRLLLICGIVSPLVFIAADIGAGLAYPGYDFRSQAVSELFAIGAPTSRLVVACFSLASLLLLAFAYGVWRVAGERRALQVMAVLFALSALNGLLLWNLFPMHMRGSARTFTDTMHLALAANPFVPLSLVLGVIAFKRWFRYYSLGTIVTLLVLAGLSFSYALLLDANAPTPWLGFTERIAQWTFHAWQIVLVMLLMQRAEPPLVTPSAAAPAPARSASPAAERAARAWS